jgi:acyl carrier protein
MNQSQFDQLVATTCEVDVTDSEVALVDLGIDSLGHLALLMAIEERYGIEIDPDELLDPALSTAAGLWRYAEGRVGGQAPAPVA